MESKIKCWENFADGCLSAQQENLPRIMDALAVGAGRERNACHLSSFFHMLRKSDVIELN